VLERFGKRNASQRFEAFVAEDERGTRRPALSGEGRSEVVRRVNTVLGDGQRAFDAILGDAKFVSRVMADADKVRARMNGRALPRHRGDAEQVRPALSAVVDAVCAELGLEPWEFERQPKRPANVLARRLIAWLWVHHFGGKQVEVARELAVPTAAVARWYGRAVENAAELEERAASLAGKLTRAARKAARKSEQGRGGEAAMWYTVDVR
jgi:hypothetical protein